MINFRYHLISLTAVFLALGVGLAMGAAFIDRATVRTLNDQLEAIEDENNRLQETNAELQRSLDLSDRLAEDGGLQLLADELAGVPVVMVTVRGVDEALIAATREALAVSGAAFGGTLWLTDRLLLEGEEERTDLADALSVPMSSADRLQRIFASRLGGMLGSAARPENVGDPPAQPDGITEPETTTTVVVREPELLADLRAAGFIELEHPETEPADFEVLPSAGARYLVVGGPEPVIPDETALLPMLRRLAFATGPSTVVVEATRADLGQDGDTEGESSLVDAVRSDEELRELLSTVDGADTFAGRVALVLALKHLSEEQVGHYGVDEGADTLVPPPVGE